ncbi:MAG: hypothetical protein ACOYOS_18505, partial [Syntrophales bacterium]
ATVPPWTAAILFESEEISVILDISEGDALVESEGDKLNESPDVPPEQPTWKVRKTSKNRMNPH